MARRPLLMIAVVVAGSSALAVPAEVGAAAAAPAVTAISTHSGTVAGGRTVTITGRNFVAGPTTVYFGATRARSVKRLSSTRLTAVSPLHAGGVVHVRVGNGHGRSSTHPVDRFRYVVSPVTRLRVLATTATSVRLGWTNPAKNRYATLKIRRAGTVIATLKAGTGSYTDRGRHRATRYSYTVTAYFHSATPSSVRTIRVATSGAVPTVTGLHSASTADTTAHVRWTDPSSALYETLWVRRSSGSVPVSNIVGAVVATLPHGSTSFADTDLRPGTVYHYSVTPYFGAASAPNGPVTTVTTTNTRPPADVTALAVSPGVGAATLTWQNPTDVDLAGVRVCRATGVTAPASLSDPATCGRVADLGLVASWRDSGLSAGTYWYSVFALDAAGNASGAMLGSVVVAGYAGPGPVQQPSSDHVTADALPTVQIDGGAAGGGAVAWCQVVVGNTVYVGGDFSTARPAGAARGTDEVARHNVLAYDITTGDLVTSFADPQVNGVVSAIAASPDGRRIYIGGAFTTVGGQSHPYLAALDAATGALDRSFAGATGNTVSAIVATSSAVYAGGNFFTARDLTAPRGVTRSRLARFDTAGGVTAWSPTTDNVVRSMLLTPDGSKVVVGGSFTTLDGVAVYGIGAVTADGTGTSVPWKTSQIANDYGLNAGITSLTTDGVLIYGTGFNYLHETGNLEGTFAVSPDDGHVVWLEDCHGDTYGSFVAHGIVYTVSHAHYCRNVGGWTDQDPPVWKRTVSFTADATGVLLHQPRGTAYHDFGGTPAPSLIDWFPTLTAGTYTGQGQAAWSVTGNADYVVEAGEFPSVNGRPQQGLVRFAVRGIAPAQVGAQVRADLVPTVTPTTNGGLTITVQSNWDADGLSLTYQVVRDGLVVDTIPAQRVDSTWWDRPTVTFTELERPSGTHTYRIRVTDDDGNVIDGPAVSSG